MKIRIAGGQVGTECNLKNSFVESCIDTRIDRSLSISNIDIRR